MMRRRQAGTMVTSVFPCLFIILLTGGSPAGCSGDGGSASHSKAGAAEKPILLNSVEDAEAFISGAEVAVIGFFQVDNDRRDLDMNDKEVDVEKMTRFVRMNELRLVTEYNPVTAIGVMQSSLQLHLLLITDKMSPKHPERMRKYRAAAELFKGKVLFILLDSNLKSNERVVSFFNLKKSQLPALAIFHAPDEEQDVLTVNEVSVERVEDFCNNFLQRLKKKEDEPQDNVPNEEL
ncbi:PREDICTED: endoplasmic reticulum resident protein 27 [Chaetura pelagica]|uniref:endoplasmic reticulum resident protein 27 n=1 Tax=Chaetura pelagica TaxID=8897 RepID=UPI0005232369|nr:PREDICTED: endoplasmic reticulum resident protein 27 [Chaetura pelagica]